VFGAPDDLILKILAQVIEVIAVSCNANNQVTVLFRMLLRIAKRFGADNVKLYMVPVEAEIASYQCRKFLIALLILKKLR